MRDIIWTVIIIWVIWRLISAFKTLSSVNTTRNSANPNSNQNTYQNTNSGNQPKKGELKSDAGEYIDYEEVK